MKTIETYFKGYRFRSRIEARWAVFYDSLGIQWEYEKEGFDLGDGVLYLPDFYIPHLDCWIEIKGDFDYDHEKIERFAQKGNTIYVFCGQIPDPERLDCSGPSYDNDSAHAFLNIEINGENLISHDIHYVWCECFSCGMFGITFDARSDRLPCKESYDVWWSRTNENSLYEWHEDKKCERTSPNGDKEYNGNSLRLTKAYRAACSARFEYGESG